MPLALCFAIAAVAQDAPTAPAPADKNQKLNDEIARLKLENEKQKLENEQLEAEVGKLADGIAPKGDIAPNGLSIEGEILAYENVDTIARRIALSVRDASRAGPLSGTTLPAGTILPAGTKLPTGTAAPADIKIGASSVLRKGEILDTTIVLSEDLAFQQYTLGTTIEFPRDLNPLLQHPRQPTIALFSEPDLKLLSEWRAVCAPTR